MAKETKHITFGDFDSAKREFWSDLRRHKDWFRQAYEFWSMDYCKTGSAFAQDMMNQCIDAYSKVESKMDYVERYDVVVAPRMTFPSYPER